MFDYKDEACPYCNVLFGAGEDIAVCPDCGAPHHRDCYAGHGCCAYAEQHDAGYEWQPEHTEHSDSNSTVAAPFSEGKNSSDSSDETGRLFAAFRMRDEAEEGPAQAFAKEFDGISVADWLKYIGRNAVFYLGFFNYQERTGRKKSFTFSAALFPVVYFLYRKMWWIAAAAAALNLALGLPAIALYLTDTGLLNLGLDVGLLTSLQTYFYYASLAVGLFWGIFAMSLYRRSAGRRIRRRKLRYATEQEFQGWLQRVSGPSIAAVLFPFAALMAALLLLNFFGLNLLGFFGLG